MKRKKIITGLVTAALIMTTMLPAAASASTAGAWAIQMGVDSLGTEDMVCYGNDGRMWRVLSVNGSGGYYMRQYGGQVNSSGAMLMMSLGGLYKTRFNFNNDSDYENSYLRENLTKVTALANQEFFSAAEKEAMLKTFKSEKPNSDINDFKAMNPKVWGDKLFILSAEEMQTYLKNDKIKMMMTEGEIGGWWLRSAFDEYSNWMVDDHGKPARYPASFTTQIVGKNPIWVRPAFNLDKEAVVFISGKNEKSRAGMDEGLTPVSANAGIYGWELTLKDDINSGRGGFRISDKVVRTEEGVSVRYWDAKTGNNEYISAMIRDEYDGVRYYGRVKNLSSGIKSDVVEIKFSDIPMESGYKLYVFNEQYNGNGKTHYTSQIFEVKIPDKVSAPDVDAGVMYGEDIPPEGTSGSAAAAEGASADLSPAGQPDNIKSGGAADTGDNMNPAAWAGALVLAAGAGGVLLYGRRKRRS